MVVPFVPFGVVVVFSGGRYFRVVFRVRFSGVLFSVVTFGWSLLSGGRSFRVIVTSGGRSFRSFRVVVPFGSFL